MSEPVLWLLQLQTTNPEFPSWVALPVSLGGFSLLLYLVLSRRLVHPATFKEMKEEKDRQIERCEADIKEWKAAASAERQAREKESDARSLESRRADAAVDAARTVADALDALRAELGRH